MGTKKDQEEYMLHSVRIYGYQLAIADIEKLMGVMLSNCITEHQDELRALLGKFHTERDEEIRKAKGYIRRNENA